MCAWRGEAYVWEPGSPQSSRAAAETVDASQMVDREAGRDHAGGYHVGSTRRLDARCANGRAGRTRSAGCHRDRRWGRLRRLRQARERGRTGLLRPRRRGRPGARRQSRSGRPTHRGVLARARAGIAPGQLYGYVATVRGRRRTGLRFDPTKVLLDPYGRGVAVPTSYRRLDAGVTDDMATAR